MTFKSNVLILVALWVALGGCGTTTTGAGASAPPISLPAPVTGRMTVVGPDESGLALVVGDEGSVPAGSVVHAINGSKETVALRVIEGMFGWVTTAQAQGALPEICSRAFHACAIADDTGSFEISIPAVEDEEIFVEILDPATGTRISERFHQPVPRNTRHFARVVNDLGLLNSSGAAGHKLFTLMPRTPDDPHGLVAITDLETGVRTLSVFDGPNPSHIAVHNALAEAAVTDPADEFVAKINLTTGNFASPVKVDLARARDVAINADGHVLLVSTGEPDNAGVAVDARMIRSFNFNSLVEGDPIRISALQAFLPGATNVDTLALDVRTFTDGAILFDLAAFIGLYDVGGTPTPAVGLFDASGMNLLTALALPAGTVPEDVVFTRNTDQVLVTDSGNDRVLIFDFAYVGGAATLTAVGSVNDPSGGLLTNPRDIVVHPDGLFAFVTAKNGTDDRADTVLTVDLTLNTLVDFNPVGFGPSGLVFDAIDQRLFVSAFKSKSVTFWDMSELLP